MSFFQLAALFVTLVALGGWLNVRTLKLPHGVAMLFVGIAGALILFALQRVGLGGAAALTAAIGRFDFSRTVLGYLLGFLLFAGAMQVDLSELRRRRLAVWTLATLGVVASTGIVGLGVWLAAGWLGLALPLPWALVFGALISPTDPVAVLATVRRGQLSKTLRVVLQGEALFNDGVGIVLFTALLAFATGAAPSPSQALFQVVLQAAGGLALGLIAAVIVIRAMRVIDDYVVEVSLSLALAMGCYAAAQGLHLSGPIAVVGAGLLMGASRNDGVMSETTRQHLSHFWTLIDELLNAVLFFLLGLELLVIPLQPREAGLAIAAIALVVAARAVVVLPWGAYFHLREEERGAGTILVWGGLHGALSLALALSIPASPNRPVVLAITYAVAAFSVAVQGVTFGSVARLAALRRRPRRAAAPKPDADDASKDAGQAGARAAKPPV
ncbi:MAG: cation:proton antiporter [Caulobacterales bacterium]